MQSNYNLIEYNSRGLYTESQQKVITFLTSQQNIDIFENTFQQTIFDFITDNNKNYSQINYLANIILVSNMLKMSSDMHSKVYSNEDSIVKFQIKLVEHLQNIDSLKNACVTYNLLMLTNDSFDNSKNTFPCYNADIPIFDEDIRFNALSCLDDLLPNIFKEIFKTTFSNVRKMNIKYKFIANFHNIDNDYVNNILASTVDSYALFNIYNLHIKNYYEYEFIKFRNNAEFKIKHAMFDEFTEKDIIMSLLTYILSNRNELFDDIITEIISLKSEEYNLISNIAQYVTNETCKTYLSLLFDVYIKGLCIRYLEKYNIQNTNEGICLVLSCRFLVNMINKKSNENQIIDYDSLYKTYEELFVKNIASTHNIFDVNSLITKNELCKPSNIKKVDDSYKYKEIESVNDRIEQYDATSEFDFDIDEFQKDMDYNFTYYNILNEEDYTPTNTTNHNISYTLPFEEKIGENCNNMYYNLIFNTKFNRVNYNTKYDSYLHIIQSNITLNIIKSLNRKTYMHERIYSMTCYKISKPIMLLTIPFTDSISSLLYEQISQKEYTIVIKLAIDVILKNRTSMLNDLSDSIFNYSEDIIMDLMILISNNNYGGRLIKNKIKGSVSNLFNIRPILNRFIKFNDDITEINEDDIYIEYNDFKLLISEKLISMINMYITAYCNKDTLSITKHLNRIRDDYRCNYPSNIMQAKPVLHDVIVTETFLFYETLFVAISKMYIMNIMYNQKIKYFPILLSLFTYCDNKKYYRTSHAMCGFYDNNMHFVIYDPNFIHYESSNNVYPVYIRYNLYSSNDLDNIFERNNTNLNNTVHNLNDANEISKFYGGDKNKTIMFIILCISLCVLIIIIVLIINHINNKKVLNTHT